MTQAQPDGSPRVGEIFVWSGQGLIAVGRRKRLVVRSKHASELVRSQLGEAQKGVDDVHRRLCVGPAKEQE